MLTSSVLAQSYYYNGNGVGTFVGWGFNLIGIAGAIYVIVDASRRPDTAWQATGQQKGLWVGLGIGGIVLSCCCGILGIVLALVYHFTTRPKLEAAGSAGFMPPGGPGGYGAPPAQPWNPPPAGGPPPPPAPGWPPPGDPSGQGAPPPAPGWPPPVDPPAPPADPPGWAAPTPPPPPVDPPAWDAPPPPAPPPPTNPSDPPPSAWDDPPSPPPP